MTVDKYQKYQEKVEAAAIMLCQLKQIDKVNKGYEEMTTPDVEELSCVSSYPIL